MDQEIYDYELYLKEVMAWNKQSMAKSSGIPPGRIILFVSHCLKDPIYELVETLAEYYGIRIEKVGGFSQVKKIFDQERPQSVIGIACFAELSRALEYFKIKGVPAIALPLTCDGCQDTEVDYFLVNDLLASI